MLKAVNSLKALTGGQTLAAANPDSWPAGGLAGYLYFKDTEEEALYLRRFCEGILERVPQQRIGISARSKYRRRFVDKEIKKRVACSIACGTKAC